MSVSSLGADERLWAIEFPFNTLEIICYAANIPQESQSPVETTKLVLPDFNYEYCHPRSYNAGSIDYIVLNMDQIDKVREWAEHHGLCENYTDFYWCRIDGVLEHVKRLDPVYTKKSKAKPEKILRKICKEMEEERAGKTPWNRKKAFRLAQMFRRKKRARQSWTEFLLSQMRYGEYCLRRLRFKLRRLHYYLETELGSDLTDDEY